MKFWPSAKCPRCLSSIETSEHVLQCPSISARRLALSLKQKFAQYLSQIQTAPSLQITLLKLVDAAIWDSTPNPHHQFLSTTSLQAQLQLDIHDFVCGRLVNTWKDLQSIHFDLMPTLGPKKSSSIFGKCTSKCGSIKTKAFIPPNPSKTKFLISPKSTTTFVSNGP